ncbi:MAG: M48 family metallopeptidase [Cellvibrio sp.]|jgi:Putative Zn-dependent protease, contains TPR repeats
MRYENRQPPEGINVVEHGWVRDFVLLIVGFFAGLFLLCWLLLQLVAWTARWTPFSWEQTLTQSWPLQEQPGEHQEYLQQLTTQLAQAGGLSSELSLQVHYSSDDTVNALATLGGHMVIFQGLVDAVETEQGLAFVIAHEIAHIQHRHPIQAVARSLSMGLVSAMIFGQTDLAHLAGVGGNVALLNYSRQQEADADRWALQALHNYYGHVAGADELFRKLIHNDKNPALPEWLSTHPDLEARIARLRQLAIDNGYVLDGQPVPLAIRQD